MNVLQRLISMGPAEIAERLRQAVSLRIDRAGRGSRVGHAPDPLGLAGGWDEFRARADGFFAGTHDLDATADALRRLDPEDEQRVIAAAEAVLTGRLGIFGAVHDVGSPPDWTREPVTGVRYPTVHWSRIDYMRPDVGGEYKTAWEIARHQYFFDLGRAWAYRRDERYADAFVSHVRDFIRANPPGQGIHWSSSLEVAFRAMSWIWALHLFRDSRAVGAAVYGEVVSGLVMHGRHIARYLSTYFSPNTHLTGESLALYWLGATFPRLPEANRWRDLAWYTLEQQQPIHVRGDGTYFEQSMAYGRYTADFYLHLVILREQRGEPVSGEMLRRLELSLDALLGMTRPDGTTPSFGDDDGGRLLPVDDRGATDLRAPLGTGAVLFGRSDLKGVAGSLSPETIWLLGPEALAAYERLPSETPDRLCVALADGGFYVQRDGWAHDANMLMIDCGPLGMANCGHAHADLLSVDVTIAGRPVIVDSGTFTYTSDPGERNRYRSGSAHNGMTLGGVGSSRPDGPFQWASRVDGELVAWEEEADWCWVHGREQFESALFHERGVLFRHGLGWILVDRLFRTDRAPDDHDAVMSFHLAPGLTAVRHDPKRLDVVEGTDGPTVAVLVWPDNAPEIHIERTAHSPSYRVRRETEVVRVRLPPRSHESFVTILGQADAIGALSNDVDRAIGLLRMKGEDS